MPYSVIMGGNEKSTEDITFFTYKLGSVPFIMPLIKLAHHLPNSVSSGSRGGSAARFHASDRTRHPT